MKINETAIDLPIVLAILSSYYNKPFGDHVASFGEIGLVERLWAVPYAMQRILEAKIGFNLLFYQKLIKLK